MNLAQVARLLSRFVVFYSLVQVVPLGFALSETRQPIDAAAGFAASIAIGLLAAALLWAAGRRAGPTFFRREGLAMVGFAWLLACTLGAIPFLWSGALPHPVDALFETVSGLTTTGASALSSGSNMAIADLPPSLLFWRSLTQWLGGLGIVLLFVALLPAMGVTGRSLLAGEQTGVANEGFQPRLLDHARSLFLVYAVLTALCTVLLRWPGGMTWFEAVNHAFTALPTGGYSTRNASIKEFDSVTVEVVLIAFMFLAGCSFALLADGARAGRRGLGIVLRDAEFRCYAIWIGAIAALVTLSLWSSGLGLPESLRQAAFNVVSVGTCTGYASADYQRWPTLAVVLLFGAMIVGGCSGSTSGGFKVIRLLVTLKLIAYTVRLYVRPKSVARIKVGTEVLPASVISGILAVVLMWVAGLFVGALLLALDPGMTFLSAFSTAATTLGCAGPGMAQVAADGAVIGVDVGPMGGFGGLTSGAKVVMMLLMLVGRLEFLLPLALLAPGSWRR